MHQGIIFKLRQNGISGDLFNVLSNLLSNRKQRIVLNGETSSWAISTAAALQWSILGPLLSLSYMNDLPDGLTSIVKLFADDKSLFSVVHNINTSTKELNEDLNKINNSAFQWKMNFKPDPSKQAQEVLFSRKLQKVSHPKLFFNNSDVSQTNSQKHLGVVLDSKLTFHDYLDIVFNKVRKTIGLLRKLNTILPRAALVTIFKVFVRPYLGYGDVLYD